MFRTRASALALVAAAWASAAASPKEPPAEAVCTFVGIGQSEPQSCAGETCCPPANETFGATYPCPSTCPTFTGCDVTTTWWLYREVMRLRGQIDALSANQTHLTSQVDALRADDTQLRAEVDALRANETQLKAEVDAMAENQTHLQTTVGALEDDETRLQAEVEALNASVQESCGLFVKDGDTLVLKGAKLMVEADCSSGPVLSSSCLSASVQ